MIELGFGSFDNRLPYLNNCDVRCGLWIRNSHDFLVLNNNAVFEEMIKVQESNYGEEDFDEEAFDEEYNSIDKDELNEFWKSLNEKMMLYLTDVSGQFVKQSDTTDNYDFSAEMVSTEYKEFIEEYR